MSSGKATEIRATPLAKPFESGLGFGRPLSLYWKVQLAGWGAYGISTYLATLPDLASGQYAAVFLLKVLRTALGLGASHALALVYHRAFPPSSVETPPGPTRREPAGLPSSPRVWALPLSLSLLLGVAWLLAYRTLGAPFRPPAPPATSWSAIPRASLDFAFVLLTWSALFLGLRFRAEARRMRRRAREIELRMLRYQLNPHFLFNALSSVRAALPSSADVARDTVTELSGFLRYVLRGSSLNLTSLEEEIRALRSYLRVETTRYGEELDARIDIGAEARDSRVPTLLLQPLVENAIKHGHRSGSRPLQIRVRGRKVDGWLSLEVANRVAVASGDGDASEDPSGADDLGIGLDNVRDRLGLVFGDEASLSLSADDGWVRVRVRLPADRAGARPA